MGRPAHGRKPCCGGGGGNKEKGNDQTRGSERFTKSLKVTGMVCSVVHRGAFSVSLCVFVSVWLFVSGFLERHFNGAFPSRGGRVVAKALVYMGKKEASNQTAIRDYLKRNTFTQIN